jgi:AraC-like DNA-binding protein
MDPLYDVLRSVRLTGGVFLEAHFTAPWCVTAQITPEDCKPFLAVPAQVIAYHLVIEGGLLLSFGDEPTMDVRAGEIVLFPRNDEHTLASGPGLTPVNPAALIQESPDGGLARIAHGGGGEATRLICGFLGSEQAGNPLIASLPRVLKLDVQLGMARDWIEASMRFAASELAKGRLASSSVMSRLSELLLVEAVRHYSSTLDASTQDRSKVGSSTADAEAGWLKGLKDPHVGRALALIHQDVSVSWSGEALAKEVALSHSAFIDRFKRLVGLPPIRYLTAWRLQTAKLQLRETGRTVSQLAHAVGYESEEAFSRAFKREFGLSPARWRDRKPGD